MQPARRQERSAHGWLALLHRPRLWRVRVAVGRIAAGVGLARAAAGRVGNAAAVGCNVAGWRLRRLMDRVRTARSRAPTP